ncbi:hypothetical protein PM082_015421 [Marasmius tenuissimus]|nr:hypothetical protein PM082_015421 [Marasmius tenuissimus]
MSKFFQDSKHLKFEGNPTFQHVSGNVNYIRNYFPTSITREKPLGGGNGSGDSRKLVVPIRHRSKEVDPNDIIFREEVSTELLDLVIQRATSCLKPNNPFRNRVSPTPLRIQIRRRVHTVQLMEFGERFFTVVTFATQNREDKETVKMVWKRVYEAASGQKSIWFPQLFGVGLTDMPMLILHDAQANGEALSQRHNEDPIIWTYLWYTMHTTWQTLKEDSTGLVQKSLPLLQSWRYWTFNLKTGLWQYDLTYVSVFELQPEHVCRKGVIYEFPSLPQRDRPALDPHTIVPFIERHIGNFVWAIGALGQTFVQRSLADFARNGLLVFGAVVHRTQPGILARFSSPPVPEWKCESLQPRVKICFCPAVPWRVDLSFTEGRNIPVELYFLLSPLREERDRGRTAYISQSIKFSSICDNIFDLVFIDEIRFSLSGTFSSNPARPTYLFVPPLPVEMIDGVPCVRCPLPEPLFYWSLDPEGKERVPEEDWEQHSIPRLVSEMFLGSSWRPWDYGCVRHYLATNGYDLDGKQCAREHGFAELLPGVPDAKVDDSQESGNIASSSRLTCPSIFTLVDVPTEEPVACASARQTKTTTVTQWMKGIWKSSGHCVGSQRDQSGNSQTPSGHSDSETWSFVES